MRRFRSRGTWFPTIGSAGADDIDNVSGKEFSLVLNAGGTTSVIVAPCTYDVPAEGDIVDPDDPGALAGMVGQEYFLRRIVGKIWVAASQLAEDTPVVIQVTAGLIIRRADNTGTSLALQAGNATNLAGDDIENQSDPWIWRRAWLLRNNLATRVTLDFVNTPTNNYSPGYGSAVDGAHVDIKTGRIVSQEERLFLDVSSRVISEPTNPQASINLSTRILADLRCLASMRTTVGNRRNASR